MIPVPHSLISSPFLSLVLAGTVIYEPTKESWSEQNSLEGGKAIGKDDGGSETIRTRHSESVQLSLK